MTAALIGAGLAVSALSGSGLVDLAFGTHAEQDALDDASGDAMPTRSVDRYFPVPSPFEDERVIAALGPLVDLACHKSDYEAPLVQATPSTPVPDLGSDDIDPASYAWIDRNATLAALSPITSPPAAAETDDRPVTLAAIARESALAAPLSSSESDIDALLSRNLLGAALSPIAALPAPVATPSGAAESTGDCPALLNRSFNRLQTGEAQTLCQFQGKVLVIVNTASYCGYTKQYEGLEAMYRTYKDRGLVVVGFPSNDFGGQEPGTNKEIAEFCRTTYGVQFPMFEKSSVTRLDANPLYVDLAKATGFAPKWNFHKYVVDRTGTRIVSFASDVTPESKPLVQLIERLLAERPPTDKG